MIKKLGTPTEEEVTAMNPDYQNKQLPRVEGQGWNKIFEGSKNKDAIDLVSKMLVYDPSNRIGLY